MCNTFTKLRRPKVSRSVWITLKEVNKYTRVVIWLCKADLDHAKDMRLLSTRIRKLISHSGFSFTFQYLKEAMRLTVQSVSGSTIDTAPVKVRVAVDDRGLPRIIPLNARSKFLDVHKNQIIIGGLLSILSIYRVFPTNVKPDIGSITDPFSGLVKSFSLERINQALSDIDANIFKNFHIPKIRLIGGESSGPNGFKSAWSSGIDILAWHNPLPLIKYQWSTSNYLWIFLTLLIYCIYHLFWLFLSFIFIILCYPIPDIERGRLGTVYDQAGKARVIGITSWWIQLCLKPLHKSLFSILKGISTDGTFDQDLPLTNLLANCESDHSFSCFDLSSATDRLPLSLQKDILNALSEGIGSSWEELLSSVQWLWMKQRVTYSVGQPMGAYSSWAMLALTHHVIVRIASLEAGIVNFDKYCILGDDIVINNDIVAKNYISLINDLGITINFNKSVISKDISEFAKRLRGPNIEITPIGPGLILRFTRDVFYVGQLLREAVKLNWVDSSSSALILIHKTWPLIARPIELASWTVLGLGGIFTPKAVPTDHPLTDRIVGINYGRAWNTSRIEALNVPLMAIGQTVLQRARKDIGRGYSSMIADILLFMFTVRSTTNHTFTRIIEVLLRIFSPGFYYYIIFYVKALLEHDRISQKLSHGFSDWASIWEILEYCTSLSLSMNWWDRLDNKRVAKNVKDFIHDVQVRHDLFSLRHKIVHSKNDPKYIPGFNSVMEDFKKRNKMRDSLKIR